jgi:hypothetical protein
LAVRLLETIWSPEEAQRVLARDHANQIARGDAARQALRDSYQEVSVDQLPNVSLDDLERQGRPAIDPRYADADWKVIAEAAKAARAGGMDPTLSREALTEYGRQLGLQSSNLAGFVSLFAEPIRWNPAKQRRGNGEHRLYAACLAGVRDPCGLDRD